MAKKSLGQAEKVFAHMIAEGLAPQDAARKAFGWKCEAYSKESVRAYNLVKTVRVREEIERLRTQKETEANIETALINTDKVDMAKLVKFAFERLESIRDNDSAPAQSRFNALKALEKLSDPSQDVNLIWRYVDLVWRGFEGHCPSCHESFPLWKVKNAELEDWRKRAKIEHVIADTEYNNSALARRLELFSHFDARKSPHPGQITALASPERHIVGMGAARAGKSLLLATFAAMTGLIPGSETWILARVYEDARSEIDYLRSFLQTAFYPLYDFLVKERIDNKTSEMILTTKWGSEIRIKSGKSQGSVTGRELELCGVAEPAWVPDELYEEVRARMSSRLGRIIALGTPKGFGGFLSRMRHLSGRDPKTGKVTRLKDEQRLIKNGCPWGQSMLIYSLSPKDNPEYVKSELEAARLELTDSEYAAEFEGLMVAAEGAKFPHVNDTTIRAVRKEEYNKCTFVLGIDQGARNFGACLVAFDGEKIYMGREYFDGSDNTIKRNMLNLRQAVPMLVEQMGGERHNWKLTIFDQDPPVFNTLLEMEKEGKKWNTDQTFRHRNKKANFDNWREETYIFIDQMAKDGKLIFDLDCEELHWQVMECINKPSTEYRGINEKGWHVKDQWRGDHVLDAWVLAVWTIVSQQLQAPKGDYIIKQGWEEARAAFDYKRAVDEERELGGRKSNAQIFEDNFGRPRNSEPGDLFANMGTEGWYKDA